MMGFRDKVAVVLGASAENGSGWAIAEALAEAGARVVVAARSQVPIEKLARKINGLGVVCDAGNGADIEMLAKQAVQAFGLIDIAVNAASYPTFGLIADSSFVDIQQSLEVNFLGQIQFLRHMTANMNDGGSVILMTSQSGVQPLLPQFAYGCGKAATDCLVRYAALEFGGRGIRVNSIQPGPIRSSMSQKWFDMPGVEEVFNREIPLGRVGLPTDYADAVLWLAGPAFVTGANIPISGGNQLSRLPRNDELPL